VIDTFIYHIVHKQQ